MELSMRDLAPGIVHTDTRINPDFITLIADHGYQKEVIISKSAILISRSMFINSI